MFKIDNNVYGIRFDMDSLDIRAALYAAITTRWRLLSWELYAIGSRIAHCCDVFDKTQKELDGVPPRNLHEFNERIKSDMERALQRRGTKEISTDALCKVNDLKALATTVDYFIGGWNKVTGAQLRALEQIADSDTRICCGDFAQFVSPFQFNTEDELILREFARAAHYEIFGDDYASINLRNMHLPSRVGMLYQFSKDAQHRLAWDRNPRGGTLLDFDNPNVLAIDPRVVIVTLEHKCEEA